ncbi:Glycosyl hydrolase, putative [Candida maltosa Xu316]|uniref:Glycosyl hydrolase, putative n=1 Tax=Candida maltosa (strain Xu316) TaxID=1245528 RepID=M3JY21_CANMX|nr:Glycosyl hydrolase, putative [Candida maltosa Xu316]
MRSARYATEAIQDRLNLYSTTSSIPSLGVKPLRRQYPPSQDIPHAERLSASALECTPLECDMKGDFYDPQTGRKVVLKGINIDSQMKLPAHPYMPTYEGDCTDPSNIFFDGDNVSFVGRPFPLEEAVMHLQRIKDWGYTTIRYLITWEAMEHEGPGKYDSQFVDYTIEVLKIIGQVGGLYVFLEFHQDVWSRYSGGSGAPMWTFYAAGLDPRNFSKTEAAILHNEPRFHDSSDKYHKMLWTSNYRRLASMVMFTLFFAGKNFFPNLILNDLNIQDYLQNHFLGSVDFLWKSVCRELPDLINNGTILGFESMNEPNSGLFGHPHLAYIPDSQQLRVSTTPTAFQAMKMGMGFTCEVDEYRITLTGPRKYGTKIIDPKGTRAWLSRENAQEIDAHYGFKRAIDWPVGSCIFANAGIWKWQDKFDFNVLKELTQEQRLEVSNKCTLLEAHFFSKKHDNHNFEGNVATKLDTHYFINNNFIDHYINFKKVIRNRCPTAFVFISTPVLEEPPDLKNDPREIIDNKTVYCPHYYDGLSLMFKTWNVKYNVDTLGIMRNRYLNPVLGIVFGERAIRNCFKKQFVEMRQECNELLGPIPVLMSETGMPFDMDGKRSYRNSKFISQTAAMDAICYALEGANMSHTFWCYNSANNHKWGDNWNNEDFSFWSPEDRFTDWEAENYSETPSPASRKLRHPRSKKKRVDNKLRRQVVATKMGLSSSRGSNWSAASESSVNSERDFSSEGYESDDTSSQVSVITSSSSNIYRRQYKKCYPSPDGVRAVSAVVRPYVMATRGFINATEFDLKVAKFSVQITVDKSDSLLKTIPTVIFLPKWHFPFLDYGDIYLTFGYVKYNEELQFLEWYHANDPSIVQEEEDEDGVWLT